MEFAVAAQALGLRALHGSELELDDGRHITLLVQDARGWSDLCHILTLAHAHTREGRPGAPPAEPSAALETFREHIEGLMWLSGCGLHGVHDEATLRRLREEVGSQRLGSE